jgi:large subunit ribosomal protein L17
MRHNKGFNHLGRTSAHRKAMLANMATSLIMHKRVTTTTAKAKALRMYVEPLITKSKDDSTHSRRVVFSYLRNKFAVTELFREITPKIAERPGGYTRILKIGNRLGDNADMCIIELVDYNENMLDDKAAKSKTTRRRRSGGKKKSEETTEVVAASKKEVVETIPEVEAAIEEFDAAEGDVETAPVDQAAEEVIEEVVAEVKEETPETTEESGETSEEETKKEV